MPGGNQIHTLTSHVYGPYYDYVFFKDTFPPDRITLEIRDLQLYTKDQEIGFDQTEVIGNPPVGSIGAKNEKVVFFGVLTIGSLDWLSERGSELLQHDLRKYDESKHLEYNQSGLTLKALYGDRTWKGSRLKILIACHKTLPAHFLTSKKDPGRFFMYSVHKGKKRRYCVQTLHVSTLSMSRNFLDRYRLRALIEQLIATDPHKTPVEGRTIGWLIRRYLEDIHPNDAHRRIITDPGLDAEIYLEPRHLNHLSRARIRHFFASQAEWILAHMLASTSKQVKLLNINKWRKFCHEARLCSIEAKNHGVRWGLAHGAAVGTRDYILERNLAKFGNTETFWKNKLHIEKMRKPAKAPSKALSPNPHEDSALSPQTAQFQYDSDFSEPSTPGESDSEENEPIKVPRFCMEAPSIPNGCMTWTCPSPGCDFKLDLANLSRVLMDTFGSNCNTRNGLQMTISIHFETHLTDANVQVCEPSSSTGWRVKPLHAPQTQNPNGAKVKQEPTDVDLEMQVRRSSRKPRPRKQFEG